MLVKPVSLHTKLLPKKFTPDYIVDSVLAIDFQYLAKQGIKAALIDLDGTVVKRSHYNVSPKITAHLRNQPLKIYIATNRPKSRDLKDLKELLHANGVIHPKSFLGKPFPQYYAQAAKDHQLKPSEVVMIGDRYLQDIYGANLAGFKTIVVRKLGQPTNVIDKILSKLERRHTDKLTRSYRTVTR